MELIKGRSYKVKGIHPQFAQRLKDAYSRGSLTVIFKKYESEDSIGVVDIKAGTEELMGFYTLGIHHFNLKCFTFTPLEVSLENK